VAPDVPAIHRRFDYSVPPAMATAVHLGSRVRIELNGRRVAAWVVEDDVPPTPGVTVKALAASSGEGPPPPVLSLAEWAAWRWAGPITSFLGTASPERVVRRPRSTAGEGVASSSGPQSPGGGSVDLVSEALEGGRAERDLLVGAAGRTDDAVGTDVREATAVALTANSRHRIGDVREARRYGGPHVFVRDRLAQLSSSNSRAQ